eukprot:Gb_20806 [translate_table: standard]
MSKPVWAIGPVSLCNAKGKEMSERGKAASIEEAKCLQWLDSQSPRSVVYVSFGSHPHISDKQIHEIALGLEASQQPFIWVMRDYSLENTHDERCKFPEEFEERTLKKRGVIIRGWAPQLLILSHPSVGGFITHCGWNSTLESICAGVPMITWPLFAEQHLNAKMVIEILRIGLPIPSCESNDYMLVGWECIKRAVLELLVEEKGRGARCRAIELGEAAQRALKKGGSSYKRIDALIQQMCSIANANAEKFIHENDE